MRKPKPARERTSITISPRCRRLIEELQAERGGASLGNIIEEAVTRLHESVCREAELRARALCAKVSGGSSNAPFQGTMSTLSSLLEETSPALGRRRSKQSA